MSAPRLAALALCFFLSGAAGLVYQTAWSQQLAVVFGGADVAVVAVLAAYMAGLTIGARLAADLAASHRRPLLAYAALEAAAAAGALLVGPALRLAGRVQDALFGGLDALPDAGAGASALFPAAAALAILFVPTACLGATLPFLARAAVREESQIGRRVGLLYGLNTLGAAAGAATSSFVLLPALGLSSTIAVAAAATLLVAGAAALLSRGEDAAGDGVAPLRRTGDESVRPTGARWALPLLAASGAVSFSYEVLWTRLLEHPLGGSIYAFGAMLAAFLVGLAVGTFAAAFVARSAERARIGYAVAQLGTGLFATAGFLALERVVASGPLPPGSSLLLGTLRYASLLLPATACAGATFPLAVRLLARKADEAAAASGLALTWNTVGAVVGAVATGLVLLPALRFEGMFRLAAAASFALAGAAALGGRRARTPLGVCSAAALVAAATIPLPVPWSVLSSNGLDRPVPGVPVHYAVGRNATVLVTDAGPELRLSTNGLPESAIQPPGARAGRFAAARWLSLLPLAARPEARSLLVVGLGAGVTIEELPASIAEIDVVELEPEVLRANRVLAESRRCDPLSDPRVRVRTNDARTALRLTARRFDAIVSQPSHPWTAGAAHLFTREFFASARARLVPGGVLTQWIGLQFVDEELFRSLLATLTGAFANVEVYRPDSGPSLLFVASDSAVAVEAGAARALASDPAAWAAIGVLSPLDLAVARVLDADGARRLAEGKAAVTDDRNLFQTRSPRAIGRPLDGRAFTSLLAPYDPLARGASDGELLYAVRRLLDQRAMERALRLASAVRDGGARKTAFALYELALGRSRSAGSALEAALARDPRDVEALSALLRLQGGRVAGGPAPLERWVASDPLVAAAAESLRAAAEGLWPVVRARDASLAAVPPEHPLFSVARRLRIDARLRSTVAGDAREALRLLDPLLARRHRLPEHLLRVRLALAAGDRDAAIASLLEVMAIRTVAGGSAPLRSEAAALSEALPPCGANEVSCQRRRAVLRAAIEGRDASLGAEAFGGVAPPEYGSDDSASGR